VYIFCFQGGGGGGDIRYSVISHLIIIKLVIFLCFKDKHAPLWLEMSMREEHVGPRGRYKSQTGSTWITNLNKSSSYSRTRHTTIVLSSLLFKSAIRVDPVLYLPFN